MVFVYIVRCNFTAPAAQGAPNRAAVQQALYQPVSEFHRAGANRGAQPPQTGISRIS
jgi:hypothetical protein